MKLGRMNCYGFCSGGYIGFVRVSCYHTGF